MIFGAGIGVCAAVLILFIAYIVQRHTYASRINELSERVVFLEGLLAYNYEYGYAGSNYYGSDGNSHNEQDEETQTQTGPPTIVTSPTEPEEIQTIQQTTPETTPETTTTQPQTTQPETTPEEQTTSFEAITPVTMEYVWVHIPANIDATAIAHILHDAGIIPSVNAFVNYLVSNNFTVSIMAGNFLLPTNGDFETIMSSILAGGI